MMQALLILMAVLAAPEAADGFTSIFDGKSLDGWEGKAGVFRVEAGAVVAGSLKQRIPRNEFLCTTSRYSDFELRLEARLTGAGDNAGIQFRSERIPNHHEVKGYQADMGHMGERNIWGALYDESRRRKFLAYGDNAKLQKVFKKDGWNRIRIRCEGPRIQIWVNDLQTVDYRETAKDIPQSGVIALQIHGGAPAEASYRNIRLKRLDKPHRAEDESAIR